MADMEDDGMSVVRKIGQWIAIQCELRKSITVRQTTDVIKATKKMKVTCTPYTVHQVQCHNIHVYMYVHVHACCTL